MLGSRPSTSAAISNCRWDIVHGFAGSGDTSAKPRLGTASTFWAMIPPACLTLANRPNWALGTHYTTRHRDAADHCPRTRFAGDFPRRGTRRHPVPEPAAATLQPRGPRAG